MESSVKGRQKLDGRVAKNVKETEGHQHILYPLHRRRRAESHAWGLLRRAQRGPANYAGSHLSRLGRGRSGCAQSRWRLQGNPAWTIGTGTLEFSEPSTISRGEPVSVLGPVAEKRGPAKGGACKENLSGQLVLAHRSVHRKGLPKGGACKVNLFGQLALAHWSLIKLRRSAAANGTR